MAGSSATPSSDWPRFITNPRVDTQAMYRAYIKVADPSQPWFGKLSLEVHTRPEYAEPVAPVAACFKEVQCAEPGCFRCEVKRGGFRFRWFHPLWEEEYMAAKQPHAWHPYETDQLSQQRDEEFRIAQVEHQKKMRPQMESFLRALDAAGGSVRTVVLDVYRKKQNDGR